MFDGEVVAQTAEGISSFQSLQVALGERKSAALIYYLFDLLYLDGFDLRETPLTERKRQLAELLVGLAGSRVRFSEHFEGSTWSLPSVAGTAGRKSRSSPGPSRNSSPPIRRAVTRQTR